jgi:uncharacterized protein YecE (DUF72 family)
MSTPIGGAACSTPKDSARREELAYFAARFRTVELNNSFYRLPAPDAFTRWREATPVDFQFAVKASRVITHLLRLRDSAAPLALLLEHASALGAKLGPVLFQLPPTPSRRISPCSTGFCRCCCPGAAG